MVSRNLTDALSLLDPEMVAMLEVRRRIAEDPTRRASGGEVLNPGAVLQGIQDYTGRQSQAGIISDARNMTPEEFRRQFGISTDYTRALDQARDYMASDAYRAMPDSERRAEEERRARESRGEASLQQQLAETQSRRDAEQKAAFAQIQADLAARRERVGDPTVVSSDPMTYQDAYDKARQDAAKSDPAYQLNVTKDVAAINEILTQLGLASVTSLDEFLDKVRKDDFAGLYQLAYTIKYPGDTWGVFGVPDWKKQGLPDPRVPIVPGAPTPEISPDGQPPAGTGESGTLSVWQDILEQAPTTLQEGQTQEEMLTQFMNQQAELPIQQLTADQFRTTVTNMLDNTDPSTGFPIFPDMNSLYRNDPAWHFSDQVESVQSIYKDILAARQAGASNKAQELDMINQTITAVQNQRELELRELDAERDYELARSNLFLKATEAMEQGRQFDQQYALAFQRAQNNLDQANRELDLQEQKLGLESRSLDIRQGESLQDARLRREQMALETYQTNVANPFNVAALNMLSASPASRALTDAQTQSVTQSHLNDALKTAQFHSGRQGLGIDDPTIRSMAAKLAQTISDPRQKAAMQAIAQGVSDITQMPQQPMGQGVPQGGVGRIDPRTGELYRASGPTTLNDALSQQQRNAGATQERQFQPVGTPFTMPEAGPSIQASANYGRGAIPQTLTDIGFRIPQGAAYGQQSNIRDFFPKGLPTTSAISDLPSISKGLLGATAESTGTTADDLIQASKNITPGVTGQAKVAQPSLQRLLRNRRRS